MAVKFHKIAETLERRKFYRYAEQLRAAGLSFPNSISQGPGSIHTAEFKQFLNIARRSCSEDASMLLVFERMDLVARADMTGFLDDSDKLSHKITNLSLTL